MWPLPDRTVAEQVLEDPGDLLVRHLGIGGGRAEDPGGRNLALQQPAAPSSPMPARAQVRRNERRLDGSGGWGIGIKARRFRGPSQAIPGGSGRRRGACGPDADSGSGGRRFPHLQLVSPPAVTTLSHSVTKRCEALSSPPLSGRGAVDTQSFNRSRCSTSAGSSPRRARSRPLVSIRTSSRSPNRKTPSSSSTARSGSCWGRTTTSA